MSNCIEFIKVITPFILICIIPLVKAHRENVRLTLIKESVSGWLYTVLDGIEKQMEEIKRFNEYLERKNTNGTFLNRTIPIERLLSYPDSDLRLIFFERLTKKDFIEDNGILTDKNINNYLSIISSFYSLEKSNTWSEEIFTKFDSENILINEKKKELNAKVKVQVNLSISEIHVESVDDRFEIVVDIKLLEPNSNGISLEDYSVHDYYEKYFYPVYQKFQSLMFTSPIEFPKLEALVVEYRQLIKVKERLDNLTIKKFETQLVLLKKANDSIVLYLHNHDKTPLQKYWFLV